MSFDEQPTLQTFLETTILKAIETKNDYNTIIQYTRLIYQTIHTDDQKANKHILKIIQEYDKNPELQRKAKLLTTIHTDTEASYEYLSARDRDPTLNYDPTTEALIHKNTSTIITFYGQLVKKYTESDLITPT